MKILILDFDGVIVDSISECFLTSYHTYYNFKKINFKILKQYNLRYLFYKYRYLVGPANEYYFLMKTIDKNLYKEQNFLKRFNFYKNNEKYNSLLFFEKFFKVRNNIQEKYFLKWLQLHKVYSPVLDLLRNTSDYFICISSTKDKKSIKSILEYNDINIDEKYIFSKDNSLNKIEHIIEITKLFTDSKKNIDIMKFVDDNYFYLKNIKNYFKNKIICYLAKWGYSSIEIQNQDRKNDIEILKLKNIYSII